MKAKRETVVLFCLFALFVSCNQDIKSKADSSSLVCVYNSTEYEDYIELNVKDAVNDYFVLTAKHYKDGSEVKMPFTFESDDCVFSTYGEEGYGIRIQYSDLKYLGLYTIRAKSSVHTDYDRTFSINLTSDISELKVKYTLENGAESDRLTDEMKEGMITSYIKARTLAGAGIYEITALNQSNTSDGIKTISVKSSDSSVCYATKIKDNTCSLIVVGGEGKTCQISIYAGKTQIGVSFTLTVKDISSAEVVDYIEETETEKVLSFSPNPSEDRERSYEYIINLKGIDTSKPLQFSFNAESAKTENANQTAEARKKYEKDREYKIGTIETEQWLVDSPYHKLSKNANADWYDEMNISVSGADDKVGDNNSEWSDTVRFRASFNGATRRVKITPLENTVWNRETRNMHFYLYVKFADDTDIRWKYRIMVGGVVEGISLKYKESIGSEFETPENKTLTINEGDALSYYARAEFTPALEKSQTVLFYIAEREEAVEFYGRDGAFKAPQPAYRKDILEDISFSLWSEATATGSGIDMTPFKRTDGVSLYEFDLKGTLSAIPDVCTAVSFRQGYCEFNFQVSALGEKFVLVCMDAETKMYDYIIIDDVKEKTGVFKSVKKLDNVFDGNGKFKVYKKYSMNTANSEAIDNAETAEIYSQYTTSNLSLMSKATTIQEYPLNKREFGIVQSDLRSRPSTRYDYVFFCSRDKPLDIEWQTNFKVYSIDIVQHNSNAYSYGGNNDVFINFESTEETEQGTSEQFGYNGLLKFRSLWGTMNADDRYYSAYLQYESICLSDDGTKYNGDLLYKVIINKEIVLYFNIVLCAERSKVNNYPV